VTDAVDCAEHSGANVSAEGPTIYDLIPSLSSSLEGIGFFFGAGTSVCAGYPMMSGLTKTVVCALAPHERGLLDDILGKQGFAFDEGTSTPNIEDLCNCVTSYALNAGCLLSAGLELRLRELVTRVLLAVTEPNLESHVQFFDRLKRRAFGNSTSVWIFTTNYDVVLESAAAYAGVRLKTGFTGATTRFFDEPSFRMRRGELKTGGRFAEARGLTVKLVKLHGSISWVSEAGAIFEQHPGALAADISRVVVLPRRQKVVETLAYPYDRLFQVARQAIGADCRYLLSCGFSFGDEHINQALLTPSLESRKLRLCMVSEHQQPGMAKLLEIPSVTGYFSNDALRNGVSVPSSTTLWRFERIAEAF
jgi:hypothetical protein